MAKKARKTRKEKSAPKIHEFNPWITPKKPVLNKKGEAVSTQDPNKPEIPEYVYKDFKKITIIMASFVLGLVILALIAYHTSLFNSFFALFNIKY